MTAVDLLGTPVQTDVQLAPDGQSVLFVRSQADWKKDRLISHLWQVRDPRTPAVQMTNGDDGESSPRWSPDGSAFCFTAKRGGKEEQVWAQRVAGGEALQITRHETSVRSPRWSHDGAAIFFLAPDPVGKDEKALRKRTGDVTSFDRDFRQVHLWSVNVAAGTERRLTEGNFSVRDYSVSGDGTTLVYTAAPTPLYDDSDESEVWIRPLAGGEAIRLTNNRVAENEPELSPDGSRVLFVADADEKFEDYHQGKLFTVPSEGGEARVLTPRFEGEVMGARWSRDGRGVLFLGNVGVRTALYRLDLASGTISALTGGQETVGRWDYEAHSDSVAWIEYTPASPGDVWVGRLAAFEPSRLTHAAEDVATEFEMPRVEVVHWKGADGVTVEGILTYPLGYEAGKRYPLVVQTHGGPAASSTLRFPSWATYTPVLAAKGYAVLDPNYRGSTGYGDVFLRDMVGHYFHQADKDVLAGVDALIDRGIADPKHLATMGWSAGGHMTDWLVTQTDRFGAASAGAGASDWLSMYAQSDVRIYRTPWFGGTPWQRDAPLDVYRANSPITYVWRAKTPTLILVGEKDVRVPMPQSVEMFRGLEANGVPTELLIFPGEPHGLRTLRHRLHKINAEIAWFEKYLFGRTYEMERPPEEATTKDDD